MACGKEKRGFVAFVADAPFFWLHLVADGGKMDVVSAFFFQYRGTGTHADSHLQDPEYHESQARDADVCPPGRHVVNFHQRRWFKTLEQGR